MGGREGGEGRKVGREGEPRPPQPHPQSRDAGAAGEILRLKTLSPKTRRLDAPDRGVAQRAPRSPGASWTFEYLPIFTFWTSRENLTHISTCDTVANVLVPLDEVRTLNEER